jgi:hypothetical protein
MRVEFTTKMITVTGFIYFTFLFYPLKWLHNYSSLDCALKGQGISAQGSALGWQTTHSEALRGRNINFIYAEALIICYALSGLDVI